MSALAAAPIVSQIRSVAVSVVLITRFDPAVESRLKELEEALKTAQPIQFPSNVELVKKYYDKIDAAL